VKREVLLEECNGLIFNNTVTFEAQVCSIRLLCSPSAALVPACYPPLIRARTL
jgi:hypothetical protein